MNIIRRTPKKQMLKAEFGKVQKMLEKGVDINNNNNRNKGNAPATSRARSKSRERGKSTERGNNNNITTIRKSCGSGLF